MKTALFVDFDNMYSGLRRLDPVYAKKFATEPSVWMNWLIEQLPLPPYVDETSRRRILVRRCYLNPELYQGFRFAFSQSGFEIVDCPPMTTAGKTSTDIHMVLDMVDVLQHNTHYDEFIVFSADADFSPVLRKLRRSDRRTTVFAAGQTSSAYKASADLMIDPDDFIGTALGFDIQDTLNQAQIEQAQRIVHQTVDRVNAPVPLVRLAETLISQMPNLKESGWDGARDFSDFLQQLEIAPLIVDIDNDVIFNPEQPPIKSSRDFPECIPQSSTNALQSKQSARDIIIQEIASSNLPITCAQLAQVVRNRANDLSADWNGLSTFRKFWESLKLEGYQVHWKIRGGIVLDPLRHTLPAEWIKASPDEAWRQHDAIWAKVNPVFSMSNLPPLSPRKYRVTLTCLSKALEESEFNTIETGKRVFYLIHDHNESVSRRDVNQLIRAMLFSGFNPATEAKDVNSLTAIVCGIGVAACVREGMAVDDSLRAAMISWVGNEAASY